MENLNNDAEHFSACHERWMKRRNREIEVEDAINNWYYEQCLRCRYYLPLSGVFSEDYGACSNVASPFDGRVMFEHDGCDQFKAID